MAVRDNVETWIDDELSAEDQKKLDAVIEQSIKESDAGRGIPVEQAIAEVRAKRRAGALHCRYSDVRVGRKPRTETGVRTIRNT